MEFQEGRKTLRVRADLSHGGLTSLFPKARAISSTHVFNFYAENISLWSQ